MIKCGNCEKECKNKFCSTDCRRKYSDRKYKKEIQDELKAATQRKKASQPLKKRDSYAGDWLEHYCHY